MPITTLVVGLGQIGMLYDYNKTNKYLSHAQSIFKSKNFVLKAGVDTSYNKRNKFKKKFKKPVFSNITNAFKNCKIDLIIISVPTLASDEIYKEIIKNHIIPKAILFEKPVSYDYKIAKKIFNYCIKEDIKVFVNYNRRYDISTEIIKKKLSKNFIGDILKIEVFYKKGLYNSCSHYINYLNIFFPGQRKIKILNKKKNLKNDILLNFQFIYKKFKIDFKAQKYSHELIKIYGSEGEFVYFTEKDMIFYSDKKNNKYFIKNNYINGQINILNNIYNTLKNKSIPMSTFTDALESLKYLEKVKNL